MYVLYNICMCMQVHLCTSRHGCKCMLGGVLFFSCMFMSSCVCYHYGYHACASFTSSCSEFHIFMRALKYRCVLWSEMDLSTCDAYVCSHKHTHIPDTSSMCQLCFYGHAHIMRVCSCMHVCAYQSMLSCIYVHQPATSRLPDSTSFRQPSFCCDMF